MLALAIIKASVLILNYNVNYAKILLVCCESEHITILFTRENYVMILG